MSDNNIDWSKRFGHLKDKHIDLGNIDWSKRFGHLAPKSEIYDYQNMVQGEYNDIKTAKLQEQSNTTSGEARLGNPISQFKPIDREKIFNGVNFGDKVFQDRSYQNPNLKSIARSEAEQKIDLERAKMLERVKTKMQQDVQLAEERLSAEWEKIKGQERREYFDNIRNSTSGLGTKQSTLNAVIYNKTPAMLHYEQARENLRQAKKFLNGRVYDDDALAISRGENPGWFDWLDNFVQPFKDSELQDYLPYYKGTKQNRDFEHSNVLEKANRINDDRSKIETYKRYLETIEEFPEAFKDGTEKARIETALAELENNQQALSPMEDMLINSDYQTREAGSLVQQRGARPISYLAGEGLQGSIPFMAELALDPVNYIPGGVFANMLGKTAKRAAKIAVEAKVLSSGMSTKAAKLAAQAAKGSETKSIYFTKIADAIAGSPSSNMFFDEYTNRTLEQYDINESGVVDKARPTTELERMSKAFASSSIERMSEVIMFPFDLDKLVSSGVSKVSPRLFGANVSEAIKKGLDKVLPSEVTDKFYTSLKKGVNFDGFIEENLEEVFSGIMTPVVTGEPEKITEFFTSENLGATALSVGAMSLFFRMVSVAPYLRNQYNARSAKNKAKNSLSQIKDSELKATIIAASNESTFDKQAKIFADFLKKKKDISPEDAIHTYDYLRFNGTSEMLRGSDTFKQADNHISDAILIYDKFKNSHTGKIEHVYDSESGQEYSLLDKTLEQALEADDKVVFVLDSYGQVSQLNANTLQHRNSYGFDKFLHEYIKDFAIQAEVEDAENSINGIIEDAEVAGVNLEEVLHNVDNKQVIDYITGKSRVKMRDGEVGVFIKHYPDAPGISEVSFIDPETGDENSRDVLTADIIGFADDSQNLQQSENSEIPESEPADNQPKEDLQPVQKAEESAQIPRQKDGTPDYNAMSAQMFLEEYSKEASETEARDALSQALKNSVKQLKSIQSSSTSDFNKLAANRRKATELQKRIDDIRSVLEPKLIISKQSAPDRPSFEVGENIRQRYEHAQKEYGTQRKVFVPGSDEQIAGRFVLTESGAVTPSHNPQNFARSEGFPVNDNGSTVNDRDYSKDTEAQKQVINISSSYNGRALSIDTPIIVTKDGIVISGNNRTMSGELAAKSGTDKAYIEHLRDNALQYGFTQEQIDGYRNPRVVFEVEQTPVYNTETFAKFNAQDIKTQNKVEKAIKIGKTITPQSVRLIAAIIDEHETLGDFYADELSVAQTIKTLQATGVINANEVAELKDGNNFSAIGKDMIETFMVGSVLDENAIRLVNRDGMRKYRNRITRAILPIVENSTMGNYSIVDALNEAVVILDKARHQRGTVDGTTKQLDAFEPVEYSAEAVSIAKSLEGSTERGLRDLFTKYNRTASAPASGQMDLTTGEVQPKQTILEAMGMAPVEQPVLFPNKADPITFAKTLQEKHKVVYDLVVRLNEATGAEAVVFSNVDELPPTLSESFKKQLKDYPEDESPGVTFKSQSYIYAQQIHSIQDLYKVYAHEVCAHLNVFKALGENLESESMLYKSIVDEIGILEMKNIINDPIFSQYIDLYFTNPTTKNKYTLGKEFVGSYSERMFDVHMMSSDNNSEFIVNLSDGIELSDIDKILLTANNKGNGQRIFITNSKEWDGASALIRDESSNVGQDGVGNGTEFERLGRDNTISRSNPVGSIPRDAENSTLNANIESGKVASMGDSAPEVSDVYDKRGFRGVKQDDSSKPVGDSGVGRGLQGEEPENRQPRIGENNILISADRIEELRKRAKELFSQLNSGYNPELFAVITELSAGYIEHGVRKFADFAHVMISEFGDVVKPYLAAMYEGARRLPGMEDVSKEMDSTTYVDNYLHDKKITKQDGRARKRNTNRSLSNSDGSGIPYVDGGELMGLFSPSIQVWESQSVSKHESRPDVRPNGRADRSRDDSSGGSDGSNTDELSKLGGGELRLGQQGGDRPIGKHEGTHTVQRPRVDRNVRNFRIVDVSKPLVPNGEISKIKANIEAIKVLKSLKAEGIEANDNDKITLSQYSGWGGVATVLDRRSTVGVAWDVKYKKYHDQIKELLTPEEFTAAVNSTISAHYTSPEIISSIWSAVERLGFKGGAILEPAMGIGNFYGVMPSEVAKQSKLAGYELDEITGGIAQLLYPDANIKVAGYETSTEQNGAIDLVITNVPFGKTAPYDAKNKDISSFSLHNYFIAKGLRQLKDGGLGVFVTSSSTMDSRNSAKFREWSEKEGNSDFIGAIRLPNTAFEANAGTSVTADILFYRKRNGLLKNENAQAYSGIETIRTASHKGEQKMMVNEYYVANPQMMLGEMKFAFEVGKGGLYSDTDQTLQPKPDSDLSKELAHAIEQLPENIFATTSHSSNKIENNTDDVVSTFVKRDGAIYEVFEDGLQLITGKVKVNGKEFTKAKIVSDFIDIKDGAKNLINLEQNSNDDTEVEAMRTKLDKAYDNFVGKYGKLNRNKELSFLQDDIQYIIPYSIENVTSYYEKSKNGKDVKRYNVTKADILSRRINRPVEMPTSANSAQDAVNLSIRNKGVIDVDFIAELLDTNAQGAEIELIDDGLVFVNPQNGKLEQRSEYLSGYVKDKLELAREYAKNDHRYEYNVAELERVIPKDILPSDVNFRLGSYWIPAEFVRGFFREQFGVRADDIKYSESLNEWVLGYLGYSSKDQTVRGYRSSELASKVLNQRQVVVYDKIGDRNVKNVEATAEVAAKMSEINDSFIEYIQSNDEAMKEIASIYNARFNNYVDRVYETESGYYHGASREIKLRPHQSNAVQRMLNDSVLLAHEVGTGKTFTMITGAMEMRRLGIAKKPMIVVQNSTLEQFSTSFQQLYPSAKLLVPSDKQRSAEGRQRTFAMIAYGEWDAVIIPQSFIDYIEDDPKRVESKLKKELDALNEALEESLGDYSMTKEIRKKIKQIEGSIEKSTTPKVKDIARAQLSAEKRFKKQSDRRTDKLFTFEELGVDALIVDEAHAYKKLGFSTNMGNVKGIDTSVSKRAFSMKMKTEYIQDKAGGRNVVFATGTPITNTMAESWTMMRFIAPDILKRYGIENFDSFASTFGVIETSFEFNASGNFKQVERFKSFMNAPEFIKIFKAKTDVVLSKDIPGFAEQLPKLKDNAFTQIIVKRSQQLIDFMEMIKQELTEWAKKPAKERNNAVPLVMFSRATQAAIDLRLVNPDAEDSPTSKANAVVANVKRVYDETSSYNGTQMIFVDRYLSPDYTEIADNYSVFKNPNTTNRFNLYDDMRNKLIAIGVPESEIAIVSDMDAKKKEQLFEKVNNGDVRIILGSTERMGVGVNAQRLMAAVHHVDAPARPMDFTQRNGRIIRQGNTHAQMGKEVEVFTYGVEKTLDVTAYQRLAFKQAFIEQILRGDIDSRVIEDAADEGSISGQSFEEMMGNLSGSQYAMLLADLKGQLKKAEISSKNYERGLTETRYQVSSLSQRVAPLKMAIAKKRDAVDTVRKLFPDGKVISITIDGKIFTDKISEILHNRFTQFGLDYSMNRNTEPLRIAVNGNERPAVVMYDPHNEKFSYIMRIGEDEIRGESTGGVGFLTSIASKIKSMQSDVAKMEADLRDVESAIPALEKRLNEPNKSAEKVQKLREEIDGVTKLMANESEAEEKRVAQELERLAAEDVRFREDDYHVYEIERIVNNSQTNGTYMQAPNGKPSNLDSHQWAQVRTKAFKEWFGDWEKASRIEKLRNSTPVEIIANDYAGKYELNRDAAQQWLFDNVRGEYRVKDTGETVSLSRLGIKKVTSHSMGNESHLKSISAIPKLIENSIFITEIPNEKDNGKFDSYRYYVCGLNIDGVPHTAKITVGVKGGMKYYDHALTQIEKGALINNIDELTSPFDNNQNTLSEYKDSKLLNILQTNFTGSLDANGEPQISSIYEYNGNNNIRSCDARTMEQAIKETEQHRRWEKQQQGYSQQTKRAQATEVLQKLAQKFNTKVEIVSTKAELPYNLRYLKADSGNGFCGFYNKQDGKVYFILDQIRNVQDAEKTFLHEVVSHKGIDGLMGKENAGKFYDAVFESLPVVKQNSLLDKYKGKKTIAGDEYVARMAEGDVTPGMMSRIISAIRKFFRDVLGVPLHISENDIRYVLWKSKNNLQRANNLSDVFRVLEGEKRLKANLYPKPETLIGKIKDVSVRHRKTKTPEEVNSQFNRELGMLRHGNLSLNHNFFLGMPSEAMLSSGMPNLPVELSVERLLRKSNQSNHPFDLINLENLPEAIANPIAVFDSKTQKGSKVLLTELSNGKNNFVVAIRAEVDKNTKIRVLEVNSVRSLYPKDTQQILGWIAKDGLLKWVDKKKALGFLSTQWPNYIASRESFKSQKATAELWTRKSGIQSGDLKGGVNTDLSSATKIIENFENLINDIRFRETSEPATEKINTKGFRVTGERNTMKSAGTRVQQAIHDATIKVHMFQQEVKKRGGKIDMFTNVYEALNHRDSIADSGIKKYNRRYMKPFVKFAETLNVEYDELSEYMLAKHSIERHASGISALSTDDGKWTYEYAKDVVDKFEREVDTQKIQELWKLWNSATNEILDIAVRSGRVSYEQKNKIESRGWQYYVPLRHKDFDFEKQLNLSDVYDYEYSFGSSWRNPSKNVSNIKAHGRTSKAADPISMLQSMAALEIYYSSVNTANRALLRLVNQYPEMSELFQLRERWYVKRGEQWIAVDERPERSEIEASNVARKAIREYEFALRDIKDADRIAKLNELIAEEQSRITVTRRELEAPGYIGSVEKEHDVTVMKDGCKYVIRMGDAEVASAINGVTGGVQRWLSKYPGYVTRFMAQLATSKNPAFMLPNFLRDFQHALMYNYVDSDGNAAWFAKHALGSWKVLHRYIVGSANPLTTAEQGTFDILTEDGREKLIKLYSKDRVNDTLYDLFSSNGGETGYVHLLNPEQLQRKISKGFNNSSVVSKSWHGLNVGIDYIANMSENAIRYATFLSQIDKGRSVFDAVTYAKNITVNFNRKGKYSKGLGGLFMFFNAGVQGAQNFCSLALNKQGKDAKTIAKQRARFVAVNAVLAGMGYGLAMWMNNILAGLIGDDGEEFQISDYERRTNLIIPIGGKDYIKISIPIIFRPFYSLGVTTADWVNGKAETSEVLTTFTGAMLDAVSPLQVDFNIDKDNIFSAIKPIIPSMLRPFTDLAYNQDFAGRRIYRESPYNPYTPNSELGAYNVNKVSLAVSRWLNEIAGGNVVTPAGLNEDGTSNILRLFDMNPSKIEHVVKGYTGGIGRIFADAITYITADDREVRNIPIVNRFIGSAYEKNPAKEYYDTKRRIEMVNNNNRNTEELGIQSAFFDAETFKSKQQEYRRLQDSAKATQKKINRIEKRQSEALFGSPEYNSMEKEINKLQREFIKWYKDEQRD